MVKKIHEVQSIIDASPKYKDCLLLPIGLTDGKCNDLMFSCRGKLPNNNAYLIFPGYSFETDNFLTGLLINACRKYTPDELLISYYNCSKENKRLSFIGELPHVKSIKTITSKVELSKEYDLLMEVFDARLKKIFEYNDCYARAVRDKENPLTGMPQEVLIFYIDRDVFEWWVREKDFHWLITQTLWRTGIYPIVIVNDLCRFFQYRYYYASELYLYPTVNNMRHDMDLTNYQAFMHIGEDSWCWGSERKEVIDIPRYTEDWVRESITKIRGQKV